MYEMNEDDSDDTVCGIAHNINQGCDDQASRSLPLCTGAGIVISGRFENSGLLVADRAVTPNLSTRHSPLKGGCANEIKNNTWTWTLIGLFMVLSEISHAIIAQEYTRLREVPKSRKVAVGCSLVRTGVWAFVARICLCLGLFWFAGAWGFWCGPIAHPLTLIKKPQTSASKIHEAAHL